MNPRTVALHSSLSLVLCLLLVAPSATVAAQRSGRGGGPGPSFSGGGHAGAGGGQHGGFFGGGQHGGFFGGQHGGFFGGQHGGFFGGQHGGFFSDGHRRFFRSGRRRSSFDLFLSVGDPFWYDPFWYAPYAYDPYWYYPYYSSPVVISAPPVVLPDSGSSRLGPSHSDADDYYLYRRPAPKHPAGLDQAVDDIEEAFRTGNVEMLERHVVASDTLTLHLRSASERRLAGSEYLAMTRDALKDMKTEAYVLSRAEPGKDGAWMVSGTHTVRQDGGKEETFAVGFVLKKVDDRWVVAEVAAGRAE